MRPDEIRPLLLVSAPVGGVIRRVGVVRQPAPARGFWWVDVHIAPALYGPLAQMYAAHELEPAL